MSCCCPYNSCKYSQWKQVLLSLPQRQHLLWDLLTKELEKEQKRTTAWLTAMYVNDFTETSSCEKKNPIVDSSQGRNAREQNKF